MLNQQVNLSFNLMDENKLALNRENSFIDSKKKTTAREIPSVVRGQIVFNTDDFIRLVQDA